MRKRYKHKGRERKSRISSEKKNNNLVIISSIFLVLLIIAFISLIVAPNISSSEESINSPSQANQATQGIASDIEGMSQTLDELDQVFK